MVGLEFWLIEDQTLSDRAQSPCCFQVKGEMRALAG